MSYRAPDATKKINIIEDLEYHDIAELNLLHHPSKSDSPCDDTTVTVNLNEC